MAETAPPESVIVNHTYFNGFQLGLSNADVNGILLLNGSPQIGISMSYTTAKTLAVALNEMVATLEEVTANKIMTTQEVGKGLERLQERGGDDSTH